MTFTERRNDTIGGARPMDVNNHETEYVDPQATCRGGADYSGRDDIPWSQEEPDWMEETSPEISQIAVPLRAEIQGDWRQGKVVGKSG